MHNSIRVVENLGAKIDPCRHFMVLEPVVLNSDKAAIRVEDQGLV